MTEPTGQHKLRHLNFQGAKPLELRRRVPRPSVVLRSTGLPRHAATDERSDAVADGFTLWLLRQSGLDPANYRASPLQRRLPACLRALRAGSASAAQAAIVQRPELLPVALDALLLGVTEFFRDEQVFESLRALLPRLARQQERPLRIWSAACSAGCELYSVGILLSELGLLQGCGLLGTDCRAEAIAYARHGSYSDAYLRRLPPSLRERYFQSDESGMRIREPLRSQAQWQQQNVFDDTERDVWDVILWRNTAIYLKSTAARSVWNRLVLSLRPGGLLVTGKAERPDCSMPLTHLATCIYSKPLR